MSLTLKHSLGAATCSANCTPARILHDLLPEPPCQVVRMDSEEDEEHS